MKEMQCHQHLCEVRLSNPPNVHHNWEMKCKGVGEASDEMFMHLGPTVDYV